ncbi:hypothetical protein EDB19DRAFT_1904178 [Suillus lakei]|nr:hypothetical protein EDB19DRAFT_1904178 [Suillus lakei]
MLKLVITIIELVITVVGLTVTRQSPYCPLSRLESMVFGLVNFQGTIPDILSSHLFMDSDSDPYDVDALDHGSFDELQPPSTHVPNPEGNRFLA